MRVYDIDRKVEEDAAVVRLRGNTYRLRKYSVEDRLRHQRKLYHRQQEIESMAEDDAGAVTEPDDTKVELTFERLRGVLCEAVMLVLEDVPEELAGTVTEEEFQLITHAAKMERQRILEPNLEPEEMQLFLNDEGEGEDADGDAEGNVSGEGPQSQQTKSAKVS